ncbi:hypothetical protein C8A00DRAFT_12633 [Chaetomidium leptoderma]|uniref:2EXR domain-containing protein n=1 Tax=Chaetomidium leptoderma TaxID=669021 RepID=A0AAN6VU07_9PEZI|nr:hypothetical protein C8A00DRAFT_12633 [Chaetomidium leptoderma]
MDTFQCTFHPFPLLPFELRARIWLFTVEPRTIEVRVLCDGWSADAPVYLISSTPVPVPATLQTCREARNLKLYEQAFSEINARGHYVWVNWDMDIISIGTSHLDYFHPAAPLIKRLKFERENFNEFSYHSEVKDLDAFVNVKEIFVVCTDGVRAWHGALEEHYSHWRCGEENLYLIDPHDGGRMMRATELDAMMDQELKEVWAQGGTDYPSGEPLS